MSEETLKIKISRERLENILEQICCKSCDGYMCYGKRLDPHEALELLINPEPEERP